MHRRAFAGLIVCSFLCCGPAWSADIRSTLHNLTGEKDASKLDERQLCVFCHTPVIKIGEDSTIAPDKMPHWQSGLSKEHSFTIYDDIGRMGQGKLSIGSQSIACLSCHDSNQALGISKTSADHPFGVPYRGALKGQRGMDLPSAGKKTEKDDDAGETFRAASRLTSLEDFRSVSQGTVEDRTVWWVSASGKSTRRTRNDLPLYGRMMTSAQDQQVPHIECSSCHDPHTANDLFLRVPNEGSKLCLTCHDK